VSRRLTDTRQGRAAPTLSLRLTEAMAADVERVRTELVAASPAGLSVSSSDAARVLLGEALAARHAAASVVVAPRATPRPPRTAGTLHTAADGQLSLLSRSANDGAEALPEPHPAKPRREAGVPPGAGVDREALRQRVEAAITGGRPLREIARAAGVDESSARRWMAGTRGMTEAVARKLAAELGAG
jgi:hypothetical protein